MLHENSRARWFLFALLAFGLTSGLAQAQTTLTWNTVRTGNRDWANANNWTYLSGSSDGYPGQTINVDTAILGGGISAGTQININNNGISLNVLSFGDSSNLTQSYTVQPTATGILTFAGSGAALNVGTASGSVTALQTISANINLASALTVTNNGTGGLTLGNIANGSNLLTIAGTGDTTIGGVLGNGGGGLTITNTGNTTLNGVNTYTGTTTLNGANVVLGSSQPLGAGTTITILNNASTLQASQAVVLSQNLDLQVQTTFQGSNSFTINGSTTIDSGNTLRNLSNNIAGPGLLTLNGNLYLAQNSSVSHNLAFLGTGNTTVNGVIADFNGSGSGTPGLIKINTSGTVTFANTNTYSATTTILSGTLAVSTLANGGSPSSIGISNNSAASLTIGDGTSTSSTLQFIGTVAGSGSTDRLFTVGQSLNATLDGSGGTGLRFLNNTGSIVFNIGGPNTLTLTGTFAGGGGTGNNFRPTISDTIFPTSLTKTGPGSWNLAGTQTYSGLTFIAQGTLSLGTGNALPVGATVSLGSGANSGILDLNNQAVTVSSLAITTGSTGTGNLVTNNNAANPATLTFSNILTPSTFGSNNSTGVGNVQDGSGTIGLTVAAGMLTLTSTGNTYSGATTINGAATLALGQASPTSSLGAIPNSAITINGGTLQLTANSASTNALSATFANVNIAGGANLTIAGTSGNGPITITVTSLTRSSNGTLVGAFPVGVNSTFTTGNAATVFPVTNGIIPTWVVGQQPGSTTGDFVSLSGNNAVAFSSYATGDINTSTSSTVFNATVNGTNALTGAGANAAYALKVNAGVIVSGAQTLTLGNGTGQAGLILNGGTIGTSTLAFGSAKGTIYTSGLGFLSTKITGSGGVTFFGPGTVTLSGANSYTGGTNLNGGTVSVSKDNLGAVTGALNLSGGTLQIATSGFSLSSLRTVTLNAGGGTIDMPTGVSTTISNVISGAGSLAKTSGGNLTLNNANTYGGGTVIDAGTLSGSAQLLTSGGSPFGSTTAPITIYGGTLALQQNLLGSSGATIGNLNIGGGANVAINASSGQPPVTLSANQLARIGNGTTTFNTGSNGNVAFNNLPYVNNGIITPWAIAVDNSNNGSLLTLNGSNLAAFTAYTSTNINSAGLTDTVHVSSNININNAHAYAAVVDSAVTLQSTGSANTALSLGLATGGPAGLILNGTASVLQNGSGTLTIQYGPCEGIIYTGETNAISGTIAGTNGITVFGPGTLTLSGPNTYTGGTNLNSGTVSAASGGTSGSNLSSGTLSFNGGTLLTTGGTGAVYSNNITVNPGGGTFSSSSGVPIFTGTLSGSGPLFFNSTGNPIGIAFANSGVNSYSGVATVIAGRLALQQAGALGTALIVVNSGGQFRIDNALTVSNNVNIAGTGPFGASGAGGALHFSVAGANLTGNVTLTADAKISVNLSSGNATISGLVSGNYQLESVSQAAASVLTLSNPSNAYGSLLIDDGGPFNEVPGTLKLGATGALPVNIPVTLGSSTSGQYPTLDLNGFNATVSALATNGSNSAGGNTITNNNSLATACVLTFNGGSSNFGGTITDFAAANGGMGGTLALQINAGKLTLSGPNTYSGNTTINSGATLASGALNALSPNSAHILNGTATLDLGGFNQTILSLASSSSTAIVTNSGSSAAVLTIANAGTGTTYAGTLQDSSPLGLALTTGLLILSGNSNYSNGTNIVGGTLLAANLVSGASSSASALGTGTTTVRTGATLGGGDGHGVQGSLTQTGNTVGAISGTVNVNVGATLAPGGLTPATPSTNFGILTINGNVTFKTSASGASTLLIKLSNTANDVLVLTGSSILDFGTSSSNPVTLTLQNNGGTYNFGTTYHWTIAEVGSAGTIQTDNGPSFDLNQLHINSLFDANNRYMVSLSPTGLALQLTYTPTPEPSQFLLVGVLGLGGLMGLARRRGA